jgi:hypothetical protein
MPQFQFPVFCYFCVSEKLHRKYSRNWTKQVPELLFFPKEDQRPNESRRGARGQPHHEGARPSPWPRPPVVRPPWSPPNDAPLPISSLPTENPKRIGKFSERVPQLRRRRRISGNRSLCSGTLPGRGTLLGKPLSVAHQFGLQWRTSGAPRISSHWYLLPVAHAHVRHG